MILKDESEKGVKKRNSFIRLSLRKPKEWKVALTTSVSSPAIIPPEIQLWDEERGDVLLDTSQNFVRSKSTSFKRTSSSESRKKPNENKGSDDLYLYKKVNNTNNYSSNGYTYGRSKSLSTRERNEGLVKPEEYERPPTPVMVARRISLPKDSSAQSLANGVLQVNGIVTHHRKQNSDSSSVGSRRKVKHNVSFGRVDTIDDSSSISSSFSLSKSKRHPLIQSNSSSPRIVITEVVDTSEECMTEGKNRTEKVKHRSRSEIPVMVRNKEIRGVTNSQLNNGMNNVLGQDRVNNESGKPGRKSRMELFMSQQIGRHKFTVTRVPEDDVPISQKPSIQKTSSQHHCDRGNCPFEKYVNSTQPKRNSVSNVPPEPTEENIYERKRPNNSGTPVKRRERSKKRGDSRQRRNRVASRSRQEMMSSSSESEEWSPRTPPRRRRWSRTPKDYTGNLEEKEM